MNWNNAVFCVRKKKNGMHQFCFGSVKNNQISLIYWSFFVKLTSLFNTHAFLQAFIQKFCSFLLVYTSLFYGKRKHGVYQFCSGSVKISSLINKLIIFLKLTSLYNTHVFLRDLLIVCTYTSVFCGKIKHGVHQFCYGSIQNIKSHQ